jgi:calmodulin
MADLLIEEQLQEFQELFRLFDADKDEMLSAEELGQMMNALGEDPTLADVKSMIKEVNEEGEESIDFWNFLSLMVKKMKTSRIQDELVDAFKVFDCDHDGFITPDELMNAMAHLGEDLNQSEIEEMIKEADTENDGKLDFEEFEKMMIAK